MRGVGRDDEDLVRDFMLVLLARRVEVEVDGCDVEGAKERAFYGARIAWDSPFRASWPIGWKGSTKSWSSLRHPCLEGRDISGKIGLERGVGSG